MLCGSRRRNRQPHTCKHRACSEMSNRKSLRQENYEHLLTCSICTNPYDDFDHQPKFLPCHHTFCKDCLREYSKHMGEDVECPSCRKLATIPAAGVAALQTNFYVKHIQALVQDTNGPLLDSPTRDCSEHDNQPLRLFCKACQKPVCEKCCDNEKDGQCGEHKTIPLAAATEETLNNLEGTFSDTSALVDSKKKRTEALLRDLAEEKDQALVKIDTVFEQHIHALNRRATLLKNKVIDLYNENISKLENDLEEVATAMTCIVSLKEFYEHEIQDGNLIDTYKGIYEMREVSGNIDEKIKLYDIHICFEEGHSVNRFKSCVTDLGRVKCIKSFPHLTQDRPESGGHSLPVSPMQPQANDFTSYNHAVKPPQTLCAEENGS